MVNSLRLIALAMGIFVFAISHAFATVIVNDPFTDGARSNGADPLDMRWLEQNSGAATVVNSQAESNITGSGLFVDSAGTFRAMVADSFSPQNLAVVGDSIILKFDFRIFSAATTSTTTTPAAQTTNGGFRIGFSNSNGTSPTADGTTNSADDFGYRFEIPVGSGAVANIGITSEDGTDGNILGGADGFGLGATSTQLRIGDITARSARFAIGRTNTGLAFAAEVYNGIGQTGGVLASATAIDTGAVNNTNDHNGIFTIFDIVAFSSGNLDYNYRLDNVQIEVVPEPSSLVLAAFGLVGILAVRRRKCQ